MLEAARFAGKGTVRISLIGWDNIISERRSGFISRIGKFSVFSPSRGTTEHNHSTPNKSGCCGYVQWSRAKIVGALDNSFTRVNRVVHNLVRG